MILFFLFFSDLQLRQPILRGSGPRGKVSWSNSCHKPKATQCGFWRVKFRPIQLDNADTAAVVQSDRHTTNIGYVALPVDPGSDCEDWNCGDDTDYISIEAEPYGDAFFNENDVEEIFDD